MYLYLPEEHEEARDLLILAEILAPPLALRQRARHNPSACTPSGGQGGSSGQGAGGAKGGKPSVQTGGAKGGPSRGQTGSIPKGQTGSPRPGLSGQAGSQRPGLAGSILRGLTGSKKQASSPSSVPPMPLTETDSDWDTLVEGLHSPGSAKRGG